MKVITKEFITNVLSKDNAACASIQAGETVVFETYDCFTNQFLPEEATFENVVRKPGNPATGPLYIEGAMPGDMLKIEILDIELGPVGIVMLGPNSGSERSEFPKKVLKRGPVKDGKAYYDGKVEIPVEPMIGVIGVAPAGEGVSTITPMDHGGNMDCTQIKKGAVLYLPVFVTSTFFFILNVRKIRPTSHDRDGGPSDHHRIGGRCGRRLAGRDETDV